MRRDLLRQARIIAHAINLDRVKSLTGTSVDTGSTDYRHLKEQLAAIRTACPECRFIYLLNRTSEGKVCFLLDSEPAGHPDESLPGQVYAEASDCLRRVFDTHLEATEGPEDDQWGTWISAFVPLRNLESRELAAVVGIDVDATDWYWMIAERCSTPIVLTLALSVTLVLVVSLLQRARQLNDSQRSYREAREFLEMAVAQSPSGILIADAPDVTIRMANQAAFGIRGGDPGILTGIALTKHSVNWQTYRPDGSPYQAEALPLSRAVLRGEIVHNEEVIIRDADNRDHWVCANAAPIRNARGEVSAGIVVFHDITQQKQSEFELAAARDLAEAATRAKTEFLANMSHEIRTPMTAILGYSDILLESLTDRELRDAAATIQRNGQYLLGIINDILDLSKIEAGKLQVEHELCSPSQILCDVAALMRVRACAKNVSLHVRFDGPIPQTIQSAPTHLRQILVNLTGNAVKFTEAGCIQLVARLLRLESHNAKMQFEVIDTGIGMTAQQIAQLFTPFTQVDSSAARKHGGTGLGLAISKRLAQSLGGDITAVSDPGKGSTFTLTIETGPLDGVAMLADPVETRTLASFEAKPRSLISRPDCRVLLAEDGPDNQRLLTFLLQRAGAQVTVAENGQSACEWALAAQEAGTPFHVILMDMQMPVLDGYDATTRLREVGYPGPIIALTAHAMSTDREKCLGAGCDDYLTKPVDHERLISLVAAHASRP
jgi:signal transduction histidine kinase/ActR/RegA family two-component response regulator